ncbi:YdcF family protein [Akkermansiaceae bacterium]|nr:YdcF family protein [Akkermansiaceae bacterium]
MAVKALGETLAPDTLMARRRSRLFTWFRRIILLGGVLFLLGVALIAYTNLLPAWASRGRLFEDAATLPAAKVGLVFGTTDSINGRENLYFRYRIDAAVKVWNAGKVGTLIVSGDNRSKYYNEPEKMKAALIAEGVPGDRIVCDYAGLRTFDSVVRAKEIFGADTILVISQGFQNERAIYLAQAYGMEAYGFNARDLGFRAGFRTKVREVGARVKMWLDIHFLDTKPTHLGEKVEMPE